MHNFKKFKSKKILVNLGIAISVVAAAIVLLFIYLRSIGTEMDKTSRDYVNESVTAISTDWNVNELKERASNEFISVTNDEELNKMFEYLEKNLGKMKLYTGAQGESSVFINNFRKDIKASYIAQAEFEKNKANIYISLIWKNNKWQILGYRVTSSVFKQY